MQKGGAFFRELRRLIADEAVAIAIFATVAAASVLAFGFGATCEIVVSMLVVGVATALAETRLRTGNNHDVPAAGLRKPALQFPDLLETLRHVAHDGHGARYLLLRVSQHHDGEFDRDAPAIFGQPRHRQQIAVTVTAGPGFHGVAETGPMPRPQVFGNDQVERLTGSLRGREAEDPLRAGIPENDAALAVGRDDRIRAAVEQGVAKSGRNIHRGHLLVMALV